MLQEVFYWVFNMSIVAAITGMLVMLIRLIKKIPKRLAVFFWMIPFLRMAVPLWINSPYSLMALLSQVAAKTVVVYQPIGFVSFSTMNCVMAADTYFPITYKVDVLETVFEVAAVIWLVVCLAILLALALIYAATLREMKDASHLRDNIYFSEKVVSPAVYGVVKPKIILPMSYRDRDVELVVLHETMHIRSLDNLWRILAFGIAAVHWFNPLSWLFLKLFLADLELSCDERVLAKLEDSRRKEYAYTLLDSRQGTTFFASAFGGAKIRTRIENILSFRKMTWVSVAVFTALLAVISYVLLTNG